MKQGNTASSKALQHVSSSLVLTWRESGGSAVLRRGWMPLHVPGSNRGLQAVLGR
jgi:hypothetical protein